MHTLTRVLVVALMFTPAISSALVISRPLVVGSRGADVTALQELLVSFGFLKVSATGYFGSLTKSAVAMLQKANGLEQVGTVGPKTRALLLVLDEKAPTPSATPSPPLQPSQPANPATTTPLSNTNIPVIVPSIPTIAATSSTTNAFSVRFASPANPLPRNTLDTIFSVETNRSATCRWNGNPDVRFINMTQFSNTGGTVHSSTLTSLYNGAWYVYYVRCEEPNGNAATTTASITVATQ